MHEQYHVPNGPFETLYTLDDPRSRMRPRGYKCLTYEHNGFHFQIDAFTDADTLVRSDVEVSCDEGAKNLPLNWLLR